MKRDSISFNLNNLPDRQEVELEGGTFELTLQQNELSGVLSIDIVSVDDDTHQILGEPLTYGVPLWYWAAYDWLPAERLVPMDEAGLESSVTIKNFQNPVYLLDDDSVYDGGGSDGA